MKADSVLQETGRTAHVKAFQDRVLNTETRSVSDGIETAGGLPKPRITSLYEDKAEQTRMVERALSRALRPPLTRGELNRSILAPEPTSVAHGLTDGRGRPISYDSSVGNHERAAEEKRQAYARTFGPPGAY